jgi:hypothetical protein
LGCGQGGWAWVGVGDACVHKGAEFNDMRMHSSSKLIESFGKVSSMRLGIITADEEDDGAYPRVFFWFEIDEEDSGYLVFLFNFRF